MGRVAKARLQANSGHVMYSCLFGRSPPVEERTAGPTGKKFGTLAVWGRVLIVDRTFGSAVLRIAHPGGGWFNARRQFRKSKSESPARIGCSTSLMLSARRAYAFRKASYRKKRPPPLPCQQAKGRPAGKDVLLFTKTLAARIPPPLLPAFDFKAPERREVDASTDFRGKVLPRVGLLPSGRLDAL